MPQTTGPWDAERETRAIKLVTSHKAAIRPNGRLLFSVSPVTGKKSYAVVVDEDGWSCDCPDWVERKTPCKHILAVVRWLDPDPPALIDEEMEPRKRRTFTQNDWPAYDEAQQLEHQLFDRWLWDLIGYLPERLTPIGKRGRRAVPLRTTIMMSVRKVHLTNSLRRARGLIIALNHDGKGMLSRVPNYSVPSKFFNREFATGVLQDLIERSGLVLKGLEDGGTVAIDSTGFCTSCMGAYCTEFHDPKRRHQWVKAHVIIGVKSHIVLGVRVTDEHGADCPQFDPLLRRVKEIGHTPAIAVADKAYLSRANYALSGELDIDLYVPFKSNATGLAKGSPIWNRKFHEFELHRDRFDEIYHRRSNVEAAFSAIKRKLGEPLMSRTQLARLNELLAKLLAYNIGIVIKQARFLGLPPGPIGFPQHPKGRAGGAAEDHEKTGRGAPAAAPTMPPDPPSDAAAVAMEVVA